ncbi:hypothetical protein [Streptomyces sp. PsTaAH-124]|uniref:hypothetical protein n=1 Tax=Streptomyces sp. PsTaAH-124 TaxID=1157638 RepID=UPI001F408F64|nr:hypothetical protein [Streptomyces sp. PsTaAH-124]
MEIFLTVVGEYLAEIGAEVTIDLYTDFEITDPVASLLFTELRQSALQQNNTATAGIRRNDPYMGVPLDLTSSKDRNYFSHLAHRTIGSEASLERKLIFSTIENERIVCMDVPDKEAEMIASRALQAGATTLSRVS